MRRRGLKTFLITTLSVLTIFSIAVTTHAKATKKTSETDIVIEINDQKITRKEFGEFLILAYGDVALDFLIKKRVVEQEAKKHNITVTEEEHKERLEKSADAQILMMMRKSGLEKKEDLELLLFKKGITMDKMRKKIITSLKNQTGLELVVEKILLESITYTEDELTQAYDDTFGPKVFARQIVLKTRKKAEEILTKLKGGADFTKLAQKDSIDRASAARGGEMMPFSVYTTLGKSVNKLEEKQISEIIQTGYGYHVLQLIKKLEGSDKSFEEVLDKLEIIVKRVKLNQQVQPWIKELFEKSKVEILM